MLIDKFTNTFFAVALLTVVLTVGWYSYSDYSSFVANQKELAQHSVDSTAREIEVLIANRKNSVKLFAQREQRILSQLVDQPNKQREQLLQTRVDAYFPNRLAVTVADEKGDLLLKRGKKFVGKTCREDIRRFLTVADNPSIYVHSSPGTPKLHIDILSDTSDIIRNKTVFFVSFFLDDLFRIISHGQVIGHQLTLVRTSTPELIEMHEINTVTELEKLIGSLDKVASVKSGEFRKVWSARLNRYVLAETAISGTQWELRDVAKSGLLQQRFNALVLQAAGIVLIFIIVTIAGMRLTLRLKVSRGNTTAVLLRIEEERKRIAMDLHDQVLSDISHIKRECRQLAESDKPIQINNKTNQLEQDLNNVTKTIRLIIDDLHPHSLNLLGFADTVRAYCSTLMNHCAGVDIKLEIKNWQENRLSDIDKTHLFRVLQESIDNILKHAEASQCSIYLTMNGNVMKLVVEDNGNGIKLRNNISIGHGLANIRERCRILDAKVFWKTNKNQGGTILVLEKTLSDE